MNTIFLDTGFLLAIEIANDQYHSAAIKHWRQAIHTLPQFVTTTFVMDEVVTFLNNRNLHAHAIKMGNFLLQSSAVKLIQVEGGLFQESWDYFCRHHDKHYSLTDCVSFTVMNKLNIQTAYAFDHHFIQTGFLTEPFVK